MQSLLQHTWLTMNALVNSVNDLEKWEAENLQKLSQ